MTFLRREVQFNLVTIAEALAVRQLQEIFEEFRSYGLGIDHIVINQVIEEADSPFLRKKAQLQRKYLTEVEGAYGTGSTRVPLFPYEIKDDLLQPEYGIADEDAEHRIAEDQEHRSSH
jgi:anion-transporting  ArsA/GET3 family ATPase